MAVVLWFMYSCNNQQVSRTSHTIRKKHKQNKARNVPEFQEASVNRGDLNQDESLPVPSSHSYV